MDGAGEGAAGGRDLGLGGKVRALTPVVVALGLRGGPPWPLCSRPLCSPRRAPGPPALALDFSGSSFLPGAPRRDVTCVSG